MGGTPVFAGTYVPVQTLLDFLEAGETIDNFLEGFPTVSRVQVVAYLEEAKERMVAAVLCGYSLMNVLTGGWQKIL